MKTINRQRILLTTLGAVLTLSAFRLRMEACTAFQFRAGDSYYLAKNHDFMMGEGLLTVNRRGIAKRSGFTAKPLEWVSRYGSVTYNQFGREMPNAGMNEAGLVVEMLWLQDAKYPSADERKEIGLLQWVQHQLDTARTVGDVIASDRTLRIADEVAQVHFFISDREGGVAVLELLEGKLQVYTGADLPVAALANDVYAGCVERLRAPTSGGAAAPTTAPALPSFNRFQAVAAQLGKFDPSKGSPEAFAFGALQRVRHPRMTQWQIVYDPAKLRIFLRRIVDETVRQVDFSACDFAPGGPAMAADLTQPGPLAWVVCTPELNRATIGKSYAQTPFLQHFPAEALNEIAALPETFVPVKATPAASSKRD